MASVAESVLNTLVDKFCDAQRAPAESSKLVFDHLEAIERESEIRELGQRSDDARALVEWLRTHGERSHRKQAADRCRAFGLSLAKASDQTSLAFGMRLGAMAASLTPGAIDEKAIAECVIVLEELNEALFADFKVLVEEAQRAGRPAP